MRFPGGVSKALTLSYDDGVEQDGRLLEILAQNGLRATFNLSGGLYAPEGHIWPNGRVHRRLSRRAAIDLYGSSGQEIALHALYHGELSTLPPSHALWQVMRDKEALENDFGRIVRGMAYPYGAVTPELCNALRGCGIAYARTVEATRRFDLPSDWLCLPSTCHHDDPQLMPLAQSFAEKPSARPQLFYLWGHSYEFEVHDNWHVIEDFAAYLGNRSDIWYATNIEVHDYVTAWHGMHTSADGRRMENPSAIPLWVLADGVLHRIDAGGDLFLAE